MRPEQTIKMTKPVLRRDSLYYRRSCVGITSQFLDCNRVGGQGAEGEEREEKQKRAAELHDRAAADGQAVATVMDWAEGAGGSLWQPASRFFPSLRSLHTWRTRHVWTHCSIGENWETRAACFEHNTLALMVDIQLSLTEDNTGLLIGKRLSGLHKLILPLSPKASKPGTSAPYQVPWTPTGYSLHPQM